MPYPDPYYGNSPGTSYYGGQQEMTFGIDDGLALGGGLAGGIADGLMGGAEGDANRGLQKYLSAQQLLAQIMQFNRTQGLSEANAALGIQGDLSKAPMRDQLYYNLASRMGMPQQSLSYQQGGATPRPQAQYDMAGLYNAKQSQYRPGMGGVQTGVHRQVLDQLGYGSKGTNPLLGSNMPHPKGQNINDFLSDYLKNFMSGGSTSPSGNPQQTTPYTPGATGGTGNTSPIPTPKPIVPPQNLPYKGKPPKGYAPGGVSY